ncbi:MAG: type II toxin-antitoxin system RelE/ParE family toxin [Planctomycetota bacterium]
MTLPVRILPRAKKDFRHIFSYIEAQSLQGSNRWKEAFRECVDRVANDPKRFALAPEDDLTKFELRQALFKTQKGLMYRAVFTVLDETVLILRIRGPGQPPLTEDEVPTN